MELLYPVQTPVTNMHKGPNPRSPVTGEWPNRNSKSQVGLGGSCPKHSKNTEKGSPLLETIINVFKSKKQLSESSAFAEVSGKLPECCQMCFHENN